MDDDDAHRELIRQLFYLVTVAAEEATTLAVQGQSLSFVPDQAMNSAIRLQDLGERIKILSSAIGEFCR